MGKLVDARRDAAVTESAAVGVQPGPAKRSSPLVAVAARHRIVVAIAVVCAVALALRVVSYERAPKPLPGAGLAAQQGEIARNIVDHGRWFVVNPKAYSLLKKEQAAQRALVDPEQVDFSAVDRRASAVPEVDQMPGVGVILAGLWWLTGTETYAWIQWLQILLDTAMCVLVYWIAVRLTRSIRVGVASAFLYAVWPGAIVVAKRPMLDTWADFFTIACVGVFVWARERPSSRYRLAVMGTVAGVGIYFRPFVILVPIALALVAAPQGWKQKIVWLSMPTVVALVLLAPWTIRNYYEFHRFIPTRTGLGQAVFEGTGLARSDTHAKQYVQKHRATATYGSPAYDNFLLTGAVRAIVDHPGTYLHRVARRMKFLAPAVLVFFVWRRWRRAALVPLAAAAATVVPYLFIGDDTRYYLPAAFAYLILGAMVLEVAFSAARSHPRIRALGIGR